MTFKSLTGKISNQQRLTPRSRIEHVQHFLRDVNSARISVLKFSIKENGYDSKGGLISGIHPGDSS